MAELSSVVAIVRRAPATLLTVAPTAGSVDSQCAMDKSDKLPRASGRQTLLQNLLRLALLGPA